jgi:Uma2 family endonuclease
MIAVAEKISLTDAQTARLDAGFPVCLPATEEEFLDFWPTVPYKVEYHRNQIIIMGLAAFFHEVLIMNLGLLLAKLYRKTDGFFVAGSNVGIKIPFKKGYYNPDITIVRGNPEFLGASTAIITNPYLLVEVLSESTAAYDLNEKLLYYQRLPSLRVVLFVDYRERMVYVAQPTAEQKTWTITLHDEPQELVMFENHAVMLADFFADLPE